jgi:erythromycin esterase
MLSGYESMGVDSAVVASWYSHVAPANLDFEGLGSMVAGAAAWLATVAVPLATTQPGTDLADLAPLRAMVGPAHLVGMGEGTHGTREFFQLKHRVFEFLVREMGFTHFAIEATWSEANDVNTYVLTGQGDPARLLSRLYFWTWNTQEVLALIEWMRQWNVTAPASRRVQFLGFDMQYPGAAMDSVAAFVGRVDPANLSFVAGRYACFAPYRNNGAVFSQSQTAYAALPQAERDACHRALQEVFALISADSILYSRASSDSAYSIVLHSARAVEQFEDMAAVSNSSSASILVRDRSMAENVQWLMRQAGPGARMMLWAHNGHVASVSGWMGGALRTAYGDDYVNLGFLFGTGGFNAYGFEGGRYTSLRAFSASLVPEGSLESVFVATGRPLLLFDTRLIAGGGSAAAPLAGPISMRSIGAVYNPAYEANTFVSAVFPSDYQLLMFVQSAAPSTLLPFVP